MAKTRIHLQIAETDESTQEGIYSFGSKKYNDASIANEIKWGGRRALDAARERHLGLQAERPAYLNLQIYKNIQQRRSA